jgi:hypothetical protein
VHHDKEPRSKGLSGRWPEQAVLGVLVLISESHKSAAVEFDGTPEILREAMTRRGRMLDTRNGVVAMLFIRASDQEPWTDIQSGLQYAMEQ